MVYEQQCVISIMNNERPLREHFNGKGGLIRYPAKNFVHLDTRLEMAPWRDANANGKMNWIFV